LQTIGIIVIGITAGVRPGEVPCGDAFHGEPADSFEVGQKIRGGVVSD
jgi:hypothetical protein